MAFKYDGYQSNSNIRSTIIILSQILKQRADLFQTETLKHFSFNEWYPICALQLVIPYHRNVRFVVTVRI